MCDGGECLATNFVFFVKKIKAVDKEYLLNGNMPRESNNFLFYKLTQTASSLSKNATYFKERRGEILYHSLQDT